MVMKNIGPLFFFLAACSTVSAQPRNLWPDGKQVAVSLSFDDARESQVLIGTAILDRYKVKATFYVVPSAVKRQLDGWKQAVAAGHEIGNHTLTHPCTGNFTWSKDNALENYDLAQMKGQLTECNRLVKELLGVECRAFAYPCGQKFVGRGTETKSYVPLVAELFETGRGWMDEAPNDRTHYNKDQITCIESDGKSFESLVAIINEAKKTGAWVVFGGHEINKEGAQTTRVESLEKLLAYATDPANGIWIAPVSDVARYLNGAKGVAR